MQSTVKQDHACAVVTEAPTTTQAQISASIVNADLSFVKNYLVWKEVVPPAQIDEAINEYRKFMLVIGAAGKAQIAMISPIIDEVWHCHILHLHQYEQFCLTTFGRLIYHTPCGPNFCLSPAAAPKFVELYETMFGDLPQIWLGDPDDEPLCGPPCTDDHPPCGGTL